MTNTTNQTAAIAAAKKLIAWVYETDTTGIPGRCVDAILETSYVALEAIAQDNGLWPAVEALQGEDEEDGREEGVDLSEPEFWDRIAVRASAMGLAD